MDLPEKAHQPREFSFPKREFGKTKVLKRSFQPSWFDKWPWLHYIESDDSVLCYTCAKASLQKKLQWSSSADMAFISRGFVNWKDATVKFSLHLSSTCHKEAVLKMVTMPSSSNNVGELLSSQLAKEKLERRQCFLKILSIIRFLARQGLPFRGHGEEHDSNFLQLMNLRAEDDPRISDWLKKKSNKYTSPDIQNEVLKIMALSVLRQLMHSIHSAPFLSIMIDETTDISNKEQVVVCLRWVDKALEAHEEFIGLHQVESTASTVLVGVIHDVLTRMNVSIHKIRGQCYDGASAMCGSQGGVATVIQREEPRAIYIHCYGHALNLACGDAIKKCEVMRNALDTSYELIKLIKKSPRRDATFQKIREQLHEDTTMGIRVLCPTRWTVRARALQSIIANYTALQLLWEESLTFVKDTEMKSRILGVSSCMEKFDYFFGISLGELLLKHSDNLSKTLQSSKMSASEGQEVAKMTSSTLQSIRSDEEFMLFWSVVSKKASELDIDEPRLSRQRKRPRRFDPGSSIGDFPSTVEDYYKRIYFEALDLVINGIKNRFDQPGYRAFCNVEDLLIKAVKKNSCDEEFKFVMEFYKDDFDETGLKLHLDILASNFPSDSEVSLESLMTYLRNLTESQKALISQVYKLASLLVVLPATNAVSERSFSSLRRIKTYLRATMTQNRLNNIMVLHVHKNITDKLSLIDIGNDFVCGSSHREAQFGKFIPS